MRIQVNFTRQIFTNEEVQEQKEDVPAGNRGVIAQDSSSEGSGNIIEDMLFHPKGIGQSSSWGKRSISPEDVQNMTKEELEEMERRKRMADAGTQAATMGANAAGGLLGNPGEAAASTVISEAVDHIVETNTTAPAEAPAKPETTDSKEGSPTQKADSTPESQPAPTPPSKPVPQKDIGVRLNPNYIGIIDPEAPDKTTPEPTPIPSPKPKGRMRIVPSRATDHADLTRETDAKGDSELRSIQLRAQGLVR